MKKYKTHDMYLFDVDLYKYSSDWSVNIFVQDLLAFGR